MVIFCSDEHHPAGHTASDLSMLFLLSEIALRLPKGTFSAKEAEAKFPSSGDGASVLQK